MVDYNQLRQVLEVAAREGGKVHLEVLLSKDIGAQEKFAEKDPVTRADILSEPVMFDMVKEVFPQGVLIGEEGGATYNLDGNYIIIDSLDCTKSFKRMCERYEQGRNLNPEDRWGPMIAVYEAGKCIGGVVYNVPRDVMYIATEETGFERIGHDLPIQNINEIGVTATKTRLRRKPPVEKTIFIDNGTHHFNDEEMTELVSRFKEEFPNNPISFNNQTCQRGARVFDGVWAGYFHTGVAFHDVCADPILGRMTNTMVTDHNEVPYYDRDPSDEVWKYNDGRKNVLYSNPVIVAKGDNYDRMLKVIEPFKEKLDRIQEAA
tara:strand:+ start:314 stop:1270 length:957 start_codon:yes stop_codon:yes gene_type:complete